MADHNVVSDRQGMYFLYPSVGLCSEGCMMAPFLHERVCLRPRLDNYGTCAQIFVCLCKSFESSGVRSTPRRVRPPPRGGGVVREARPPRRSCKPWCGQAPPLQPPLHRHPGGMRLILQELSLAAGEGGAGQESAHGAQLFVLLDPHFPQPAAFAH